MKDISVHVSIVFRNVDSSDALHKHTTEKFDHCLRKFVHNPTEAHVVLKVEKNRQIAEVTCHVDGQDFHCKHESDDLYRAVDTVVELLSQQLRKHKEKLTDHHRSSHGE